MKGEEMRALNSVAASGYTRRGDGFVPAPDCVVTVELGAGAPKAVTVPAGATCCLFHSRGAQFFARYDGQAAAIPAGDVLDGSACDPDPFARDGLEGGQTISLVAPAACRVWLLFYGR